MKQMITCWSFLSRRRPSLTSQPSPSSTPPTTLPAPFLSMWSLSFRAVAPYATALGQLGSSPVLALGLASYILGLTTALVSELQRTAFKKNPENTRKPYAGGLF